MSTQQIRLLAAVAAVLCWGAAEMPANGQYRGPIRFQPLTFSNIQPPPLRVNPLTLPNIRPPAIPETPLARTTIPPTTFVRETFPRANFQFSNSIYSFDVDRQPVPPRRLLPQNTNPRRRPLGW